MKGKVLERVIRVDDEVYHRLYDRKLKRSVDRGHTITFNDILREILAMKEVKR